MEYTGRTDLTDLLWPTPPDPETENAAPAGPRNGVETKAGQKIALSENSQSAAANQAWDVLNNARQWVAWREDDRNGKPAKVPYATPRRMARSDDPATWLTRPQAEAVASELLSGGQNGGVGLMLGGSGAERLGGIDLDSCLDLSTGRLEPWAAEVIERFASYAEVSGDLRDANYGSLRAGMVAFRQKLEQIQHGTVIPQMCVPIYERAVSTLILRGDLPAPDFESAAPLWLAAEHFPPPMPWIDPAKDVAAIQSALESGLMSRRQAVAERGYDVETLDAEIAADREREARLQLTFTPRAATPQSQKESEE